MRSDTIEGKAYWDANGQLPSSLDDLVPRYLADLPRDRFGGDRLVYSAPLRLMTFWSAGVATATP